MILPSEVQSYIRHILHVIGMAIVAYSGGSAESIDLWVGVGVNVISLGWFIITTYRSHVAARKAAAESCQCGTEFCECKEKGG